MGLGAHYLAVKHFHIACVVLTYLLFVTRGVWMMASPARLGRRWVRIAPHIVDTALLASALLLAWTLRQYPGTHGWLTAKVAGLVAYIGLGTVAIKRGRTRNGRIVAWIVAQLVFFYIVAVAITKNPLPFFP